MDMNESDNPYYTKSLIELPRLPTSEGSIPFTRSNLKLD